MEDFPLFSGLNIVVSDLLSTVETKQVRFPRSKRKRIRRKWEKDKRNWETVTKRGLWRLPNGSIVMDRESYYSLQDQLQLLEPSQSDSALSPNILQGEPKSQYSLGIYSAFIPGAKSIQW